MFLSTKLLKSAIKLEELSDFELAGTKFFHPDVLLLPFRHFGEKCEMNWNLDLPVATTEIITRWQHNSVMCQFTVIA